MLVTLAGNVNASLARGSSLVPQLCTLSLTLSDTSRLSFIISPSAMGGMEVEPIPLMVHDFRICRFAKLQFRAQQRDPRRDAAFHSRSEHRSRRLSRISPSISSSPFRSIIFVSLKISEISQISIYDFRTSSLIPRTLSATLRKLEVIEAPVHRASRKPDFPERSESEYKLS